MKSKVVSGILAGICISIGCTIYLLMYDTNKIVGSFLFSIGLFLVCEYDFNLYTGRICNVGLRPRKIHPINMILIWLSNFIGTGISAMLLRLTKYSEILQKTASQIVSSKISDSIVSLLILSIFCNVLIFFATNIVYLMPDRINPLRNNQVMKLFGIVICIMVFVLSGFEHCVANMYYIFVSGNLSLLSWSMLFVVTLGNTLGGVVIYQLTRIYKDKIQI